MIWVKAKKVFTVAMTPLTIIAAIVVIFSVLLYALILTIFGAKEEDEGEDIIKEVVVGEG